MKIFFLRLVRWWYTLRSGLIHHECAVTGWDEVTQKVNLIAVFKWKGRYWEPVKIYYRDGKVDWSGDKFIHEVPEDYSPEC